MATDLHPDVVSAIRDLAGTKLGRRYDKMARSKHGIPGWKLAARTTAGEFGGRSTKTGQGVVSSAGARGPAQFIPSTRAAYMAKFNIDPWKDDKSAIRGLMKHQLETGVAGYNPGDPGYTDYIMAQRLNKSDRKALRSTRAPRSADSGTSVSLEQKTIPGTSYAPERRAARRQLLLGGDVDLQKLLEYKASVNSMQDVPDRTVAGDIQVDRAATKVPGKKSNFTGKGGIYEAFYDPAGSYWDSGGVQKGAIGGHDKHVHVSADKPLVEKIGRYAESMGLRVGEQSAFGGKPTGGHTDGSFHYDDMAIDVSGDPRKLLKFYRRVIREAQRGRGR
jgi:hypothetical protein